MHFNKVRFLFLNVVCLFVVLCTGLLSVQAFAHNEISDNFNLEATAELFQLGAELDPMIMMDEAPADLSIPIVKVRGRYVVMNTHFMELVRRWIRIYIAEIERDCQGCVTLSEDELMGRARDLVRSGFVMNKILNPIGNSIEHVVEETADIGAALGQAAFVAKLTVEAAETVGSKSIGAGGFHLFCNVFDVIITFWTRNLQIGMRTFTWAKKDGAGHWWSMPLRYWAVSHGVKRAQKRVGFVTGPIEIDEELLAKVDQEGGMKKGWWGKMSDGTRARFVKHMIDKLGPINEEIKQLDAELLLDPENKDLIKRRKKLEKKSVKLTQVTRKDMQSGVMATRRWMFLRTRKGHGRYMSGDSALEGALQKDHLYILNVQENVLHRGLIPQEQDQPVAKSYLANPALMKNYDDEVLLGMVKERVEADAVQYPALDRQAKEEMLRGLLSDVAFVFDGSQPASQRYLQTLVIESTLVSFFYQLLKWQAEGVATGRSNKFAKWWTIGGFRLKLGKYVNYSYEYGDFLRLAAASGSDEFRARNKYEAMEVLLRIFGHLEALGNIMQTGQPMTELMDPLRKVNRLLTSYKPWNDNPAKFSFIPFRKPLPRCEEMWEKAHE